MDNDSRKIRKVYAWHPKTFEFMCETEATPDPHDAKNWLIPGNCTELEPPKSKKGYVNIWDGKKWEAIKQTP